MKYIDIITEIENKWNDSASEINIGGSVLLSVPKYFGSKFIIDHIMSNKRSINEFSIVEVNDLFFNNSKIDFHLIWNCVSNQLSIFDISVTDKQSFFNAIIQVVSNRRLLIFMTASIENKHYVVELLNTFQEIMHVYPTKIHRNLSILVVDFIVLYFHELCTKSTESFWDFFIIKHNIYPILNSKTIFNFLNKYSISDNVCQIHSNLIFNITGGHHGLVYEFLYFFINNLNIFQKYDFENECRNFLKKCITINSLSKKLLQKPKSYFDQAFYFKEKQITDNNPNIEIIDLHVNGIVLRVDSIFSKLCPGIISEIMNDIYREKFINNEKSLLIKNIEIKIFISYSHLDQKLINHFEKKYLNGILNHFNENIIIWRDNDIDPAINWNKKIISELNSSNIALFFISNSFMSSFYIKNIEIRNALNNYSNSKQIIVPIYIEEVPNELLIFQEKQFLPSSRPLLNWKPQRDGWLEVQKGLINIINKIKSGNIDQYFDY